MRKAKLMTAARLLFVGIAGSALLLPQAGVVTSLDCGTFKDSTLNSAITDFYNFSNPSLQPGDAIVIRVTWVNPAATDPSADPNSRLTIALTDRNNRTVTPRCVPAPANSGSASPCLSNYNPLCFGLHADSSLKDPFLINTCYAAEYDLSLDGQYQIKVSNFSNSQIAYRVTFAFLNKSCSGSSTGCGVSQQGHITSPMQLSSYQFPVQSGDQLNIRIARTGNTGNSADVTVLMYANVPDPTSGRPLAQYQGLVESGRTGFASGTTKAPSDGLVTFIVYDPNQSTEDYALTITKLNGGCGGKSLTCGALTSGNITTALGVDTYSIPNAAPGDVISIRSAPNDATTGFLPAVLVYDSQGSPAAGQSVARLPSLSGRSIANVTFTVPPNPSGLPQTYTILVFDALTGLRTGAYSMAMVRLNRPCQGSQTLSCGQVINDSLKGLLAANSYGLNAGGGDKFQFRLLNADQTGLFTPHLDIFDSSGNNVLTANVTSLAPQSFTPVAGGIYAVVVTDGYDNSQTGSYQLTMRRLNGPCNPSAPKLTCGSAIVSSFSQPLDSPEFTFNATAGQPFSVRLIDDTGVLQPTLSVYDSQGNPAGQPVTGSFTGVDVAQPSSGLYTIVALDSSRRPNGGAVSLDVLTSACAAPLPQGQTSTAVVNGSVPFAGFSFQASAGDSLTLRSASSTSGFTAQMDLYDPNGQRIDTASGQISHKLSVAGTYTAVVGAAAARTGGAYSITWQLLNNPAGTSPLACGGSAAAALTASNQYRFYTATAAAGDMLRLIFTRLSDNFSPQVELYDPSGNRLAQTSDILQKAPSDGNYLVIVGPSTTNTENGTYNLAFQRPNHPCSATALTCGQTSLRQVTLAGQLDSFTFTGTSSHQADIKLIQRTGSYTPVAELYDISGNRVSTNSNGLLRQILSASGTYTLLVRDLNAVNTGSYRVSLQDDTSACAVSDTEAPALTLVQPTGGEVIPGGLTYHIQWQSDDNVGVNTHDVSLSTDGGQTFPSAIASGLSGNTQSYDWTVPPDIAPTRKAVIRVTATDAAGNAQSAASGLVSIIGSGFSPNNTMTLSYDSLNRLTQAVLSGGRTIQYTWDAAGNLVQIQVSGQ
jgi:YD repeat-containing protein